MGNTGLEVSRLCFGGIPFGGKGWRGDLYVVPEAAAKVLKRAFKLGINFWDTAENYGSHPHIREGLRLVERGSLVLSTKTTETSYEGAKLSLKNALQELGTEYIDIYYLHYVTSSHDLDRRKGALRALMEAKRNNFVRHIGVSTHWSSVVEKVLEMPEIEVVMVKLNKIGKMDCPLEDMLRAAKKAYEKGKGVVAMKILAYGDLKVKEGLEYTLDLPFVHSSCLGIRTREELEQDVKIYNEIVASPNRRSVKPVVR